MAAPAKLEAPATVRPPPRRRRFRSLASRMVALGSLQFVLFVGTAIVIFVAEGPRDEARPHEHIQPPMLRKLEELVDQQAVLDKELEGLLDKRIEVSLYDAERRLIASNVDPPLAIPERRRGRGPWGPRPFGDRDRGPPPPPDDHDRDHDERHRPDPGRDRDRGPPPAGDDGPPMPPPELDGPPGPRGPRGPRAMVLPYHVHDGVGYLVARGVYRAPSVIGPVLTVICGFVILVLGALLTARWIVRPIERLSRTARALGTGDLTTRSRLDRSDEIGELGHRIDEMAERIEGLLVSEKELLANVAHELRTPLTRIGVALDLASEGDSEAARASLAEIAVDVSELETIVDDILTAMRFEVAGGAQLPLRRAVTASAAIAAAAEERMRGRHPARPLKVTVAGEPPPIHVDPRLFRRVIDNLLENAHKYTPDRDATIELAVAALGERVVFEIRDRGIGITAEDLPRVFTPFFRGDRSRSREAGGVGLGLTLAKRIVEAHGGTIDVASTHGVGTTVRVAVPSVP
jgi:signal transduction histidine kinase